MKLVHYAVLIALGMLLPFAVQRWDRRRLSDEQRSRAWNTASWGAALYAFGPLSMIGWVWVTRQELERWSRQGRVMVVLRSGLTLAQGTLAALVLVGAIAAADALLSFVLDGP